MSGDSQIEIPPSFTALYVDPGRTRPREPWPVVAGRYELCEDMAQMLTEHARNIEFSQGISEEEVLLRCLQGLRTDGAVVTQQESEWVIRRLAELLNWPPLDRDLPPG